MPLSAERMQTMMAEIDCGVTREESRLAPLDAAEAGFWERAVVEIRAIKEQGYEVDLGTPELPG